MIKLTSMEARHIEHTLEYLMDAAKEFEIPFDLVEEAREALEIIKATTTYSDLQILREADSE